MPEEVYISIRLDKRRKLKSGKYPVKLRVFQSKPRKQKLYKIPNFQFTESEFKSFWRATKPNPNFREERITLEALLSNAEKLRDNMRVFTFEEFENKLYKRRGNELNVSEAFESKITELIKQNRIGNANSYRAALKSFQKYNTDFDKLEFYDITVKWLKDYEKYMKDEGKTSTTIAIYLKPIKALFNKAISEELIDSKYNPFRAYKLPKSEGTKLKLSIEQLELLSKAAPQTEQQEQAKDLWFMSYNMYGANLIDIISLTRSQIQNNEITFTRAKTERTSGRKVTIPINEYISSFIKKYEVKGSKGLVFDFINDSMNAEQVHRAKGILTRFINSHMKSLCKFHELTYPSYMVARHTFTTLAIERGFSVQDLMEIHQHSDIKVTMNYIKSLDIGNRKQKLSEGLMEF